MLKLLPTKIQGMKMKVQENFKLAVLFELSLNEGQGKCKYIENCGNNSRKAQNTKVHIIVGKQ